MTNRFPRPHSWPSWLRRAAIAVAVSVPSALLGGMSVVWGIGLYFGSSTVRLDSADVLSRANHEDIVELQRRVDSSDARSEERHRAIMRMLKNIENRLER